MCAPKITAGFVHWRAITSRRLQILRSHISHFFHVELSEKRSTVGTGLPC
jgi:hypothetical protein